MRSLSGTLADTTTVHVRLPARREQLGLVRAVAEAVSVDAEYAPEDIADIRLALNEVATALIVEAVPGSTLDCAFVYDSDRLTVEVTSSSWAEHGIAHRDIGWRIVQTLTTAASATQQPFDITVSGYPTHVEFDWRRHAPRPHHPDFPEFVPDGDARVVHSGASDDGDHDGETSREAVRDIRGDRLESRDRAPRTHRGAPHRRHRGNHGVAYRAESPLGRPGETRRARGARRHGGAAATCATPPRDEGHGSRMTALSTDTPGELVHPALFYDGDDEYVKGLLPFILDGLTLGEPVAVAAPEPRLRVLRDALGSSAADVHMVDMAREGRNPGRIIPAVLGAFVEAHPGKRVRIVAEPVRSGREDPAYPACVQHEALINTVFAGREVTIVCPYDVSVVDERCLEEAAATHPLLWEGEHRRTSTAYDPNSMVERYNQPIPEPADAAELVVAESADMATARRWATEHAGACGLDAGRIADLELVVTELATNGLCHGVGPARIRMWHDDERLFCAVHDSGHMADPLAGRRQPADPRTPGGRGLLLVHQLCDLVRTHTGPEGTTQYTMMDL
ncbi:anti-sigma factor RsbA family regulatory protein [Nocardia takedensis]|uniref:anti-sigma factor RsbA family regulatory protein n=1 Tax=Nocardia takedensis TaxID=259390 RepID=UPI0002D486A7|nr:anti-sigma factor RsbA family regulatory protein [Nocardia takedensis]